MKKEPPTESNSSSARFPLSTAVTANYAGDPLRKLLFTCKKPKNNQNCKNQPRYFEPRRILAMTARSTELSSTASTCSCSDISMEIEKFWNFNENTKNLGREGSSGGGDYKERAEERKLKLTAGEQRIRGGAVAEEWIRLQRAAFRIAYRIRRGFGCGYPQ